MRVLQLTKFYAPFRGGIESVAQELATGLNARNVPTSVLCARHTSGPTCREVLADGTPVTRVHSFGKLLSTSMAPAMLAELFRVRSQHDVIHVHLPDPLTNLALWAARPTAKIVVHWHSDVVHQKIALTLYTPLQAWLLRRADAIVVTSKAYGEASRWLAPYQDKVHVVPIGIADLPQPPAPDAVAEVRRRFPGRKMIFALGRMVYYKGFEHLVEAAAHLPPDFSIVVGGTGELLPALRRQCADRGLEDRVFFVGSIPEEEMQAHFAAADMFCLPSTARSEAFGVVLLEAMRAGKPIVATRIEGSGVPWVNQHGVTGFNVPPGDPLALAAAIRQISTDEALRREFSAAARARYSQMFTATTMVDLVVALYQRLLPSTNTPGAPQAHGPLRPPVGAPDGSSP